MLVFKYSERKIIFILFCSKCLEEEFGCANGTCIPIELRCNGALNCEDQFDEINCEIVQIDNKLYYKENPPLRRDNHRTNVTVNVTVISIGTFNEIEMTFKAKFNIYLEWYFLKFTFIL